MADWFARRVAPGAVPPTSLTPIGRELEVQLGSRRAALLKWILTRPNVKRVFEVRHKGKGALLLVLAALLRRWWKKENASKASVSLGPGAGQGSTLHSAGFPAGPPTKALPELPQVSLKDLLADENGAVMAKPICLSFAVSMAMGLLMVRKAFLLGRLIALANVRSKRREWLFHAAVFPLNAIAITMLQEATTYIKNRTVISWTSNATHRIHDAYFSHMGYYRLHASDKAFQVEDPDVRICTDIKAMCDANASVYFSIANACAFALLSGRAVIRGRHWSWSLFTPSYFFVFGVLFVACQPKLRFSVLTALADSSSNFSRGLTRIQLHAERICMLQGESFETNRLADHIGNIRKNDDKLKMCDLPNALLMAAAFQADGPPTFLQQAGTFMGSMMACNDLAKDSRAAGLMPFDPRIPNTVTPPLLEVVYGNMWAFFNTCTSWGAFAQAMHSQQGVAVANHRVKELYASLLALRDLHKKENEHIFLDRGQVISYEGVTVNTPLGHTLLKNLSFKVEEGQSLLICGHNGAGKSSIIRCLCALWPVAEGKITRPGGAVGAEEDTQLQNEIYYLPQKPCNVLGSLSDQLTYPQRKNLPEEEVRRWLRYVDLEHLLDRRIGFHTVSRINETDDHVSTKVNGGGEIDWEVLLSLGEQQALSIARLLYHKPRFAILDECTSAVGKTIERRLFGLCKELGISCISITHRPALKEHHDRMLQLTGSVDEDQSGWQMTELPTSLAKELVKARPSDISEVHRRIEACLASENATILTQSQYELQEQRSAEYGKRVLKERSLSAEEVVRSRWKTSFSRAWAVVRLGLQRPEDMRSALMRSALILGLLRLRVSMIWMLLRGGLNVAMAGTVGDKNQLLLEVFCGVVPTIVACGVDELLKIKTSCLANDIWFRATSEIMDRLMQKGISLKIINPPDHRIPPIENPIQRLTELKALFESMVTQFNNAAPPVAMGLWTLRTSFRGIRGWTVVLLSANYIVFRCAQLLAPDFAKVKSVQKKLESRMQVLHSRLKAIAEPVAFSGAGLAERRIIEPRFDELIAHDRHAIRKQFFYDVVVTFFTDYGQIPIWGHRVISLSFASRNNPKNVGGALTPANVFANMFLDQIIRFQQKMVQRIVLFRPEWDRIDAYCCRILEVVASLDIAGDIEASSREVKKPCPEGKISVKGLDLVTKTGTCLAKDLSFAMAKGMPMLVTGPSACGKSLLGSVLFGLWRSAGDACHIEIPGTIGTQPPLRTIMPAPQRIYLPLGHLTEQIAYPEIWDSAYLASLQLVAYNLADGTTVDILRSNFYTRGLNPTAVVAQKLGSVMTPDTFSITFADLHSTCSAFSKPQDHTINGEEFKVDFPWAKPGEYGPLSHHRFSLVRMRACLQAVGIEQILTREPLGWLSKHQWDDMLSGGEQQRLCFARLLYHAPQFALLDECTSMVAADAEEDLYRKLFMEWNITPLTLTQRTFMPDLYSTELRLGVESAQGWELSSLTVAR